MCKKRKEEEREEKREEEEMMEGGGKEEAKGRKEEAKGRKEEEGRRQLMVSSANSRAGNQSARMAPHGSNWTSVKSLPLTHSDSTQHILP
jgi:hypothetical protein